MGKSCKVVVCGQGSVGKTAILEQLLYGAHVVGSQTMETQEDIYVGSVETDRGVREQVRFYDTRGLKDNLELPKHCFSCTDGYVLVYSIDSKESFKRVEALKKEIDKSKDKKEVAETLLSSSRLAQSCFVVPIRTKKRFFVPPVVASKYKTVDQMQNKARAAGLVVPQEIMERQINVSCTAGIFDPYIPPEGDARMSSLSKEGLKQRTEQLKQTAASQLAIRKVKDFDESFTTKHFPEKAREIYIEAHNCLTCFDRHKLHALVTERCYPEMVRGNRYRTIRWKFLESLEPSRVVQVRCPEMVNKGNLYGQVTVRMHTRQTLAIYDRFGRLMYGTEDVPKDVLEYVVFERHLANPYSAWRMHGKIVPAWAPPKEPIIKTLLMPGLKMEPWEELADVTIQDSPSQQTQWYK